MLEKAELTLIFMLSKTKKVITTHLTVLCSVASCNHLNKAKQFCIFSIFQEVTFRLQDSYLLLFFQKVTLLYADTKTAQILNIPVDSPLMKYKGLMYDKQGHLAVFFENNMLIDRFGFIRDFAKVI